MTDCTPKLVVTTNFGLEPNKTVDYVSILKESMEIANITPKVLIYERVEHKIAIPAEWIKFTV